MWAMQTMAWPSAAGIEQVVPRGRRLEALFLEQLGVRHEDQRVLRDRGEVRLAVLQLGGNAVPRRRPVRLEDAGLLGRREAVAGRAPDDVGARVALLRRRAGDQLAR